MATVSERAESIFFALRPFLTNPKKLVNLLRKLMQMARAEGPGAIRKLFVDKTTVSYPLWYRQYHSFTEQDRQGMRTRIEAMKFRPKFSIVVPVYNTDEIWLRAMIESVLSQVYPDWELCIADDRSPKPHVRAILEEYARKDARIKVAFRDRNGHIAAASNSALELAMGDFTALLDHDDELPIHSLYMVAEELNRHPDADLLYSDEDKISVEGRHFDPNFKTDWNPDLLYAQNFVCHLGVYRTSLLKEIGGFRAGYDGSQDYDLLLRFVERTSPARIRHIPHILYHWRAIPGSVALSPDQKDYAHVAARRAIRSHLERQGVMASVEAGKGPLHRVQYPLPSKPPLVSAIIGTRDQVKLLRQVVDGLLKMTSYPNLEILVVDNQSAEPETLRYFELLKGHPKVRVLRYDAAFNYSAINNLGAREAKGEILAFLNNDLVVIHDDWLDEMVSQALRPEVGAVGAKLYYPDEKVQHAGVVLGLMGIANHPHRGFPRVDSGFTGRLHAVQNVSAVTGACMVMRKAVFDQVNGFDEENLPVAFNDVDLCLKVREKGLRILFTPFAELYHLESASRGADVAPEKAARLRAESRVMQERWGDQIRNDPFYNPNLSLDRENFTPAFPPRVTWPWKHGG